MSDDLHLAPTLFYHHVVLALWDRDRKGVGIAVLVAFWLLVL